MERSMNIPVLPEWNRHSWASLVEREYWSLLTKEAFYAFKEIERLSVVEGVRKAAWQYVTPNELPERMRWAQHHDILIVPINYEKSPSGYTSLARDGNFAFRCLFVKLEHYKEAIFTDDDQLGDLLGYPKCCREAYAQTWAAGQVDSTWEQSQHSPPMSRFRPLGFTLWRSLGVRMVPHMPCKFGCFESHALGHDFLQVGRKHGFAEELRTIETVMNWPAEWSRVFGIAEIVSPAMKISSRTDWTPMKQSRSFQGVYEAPSKTLWTDNGFSTFAGMRNAHAGMLTVLRNELPNGACLLELGCGNGHLLERLVTHRHDISALGIDCNDAAIARGPKHDHIRLVTGRIENGDWDSSYATHAVINPVRLLEVDDATRAYMLRELRKIPNLIVYEYNDVTENIEDLCSRVGLPEPRVVHRTPALQAGLVHNS